MTAFWIIVVIVIIIVLFSNSGKKSLPQTKPLSRPSSKSQNNITVSYLPSKDIRQDDTIIDVTGQYHQIRQRPSLVKYASGVPYWRHQYVYSFTEINGATSEQEEFYYYFKTRFLKGEYLDLQGNTNYAFILLFDLLNNEYERNRDLKQLENWLENLGYYYPKTMSYGYTFLVKKLEQSGDTSGAARVRRLISGERDSSSDYQFEGDYWGLGTRYKTALSLKDDEVKYLNYVHGGTTNFTEIEYCRIEVIRLFLAMIKALEVKMTEAGTTVEKQITSLSDLVTRIQFKYQPSSQSYRYTLQQVESTLYSNIYKHAENTVRDAFGNKRKVNIEIWYTDIQVKVELDSKLFSLLPNIIEKSKPEIKAPDEPTEIELNARNTKRWKSELDELVKAYENDPAVFKNQVIELGKMNKNNPSVENIFFEASKVVAKKDKEISLTLYIHYLYHDLKSATFDNKQLTKTIQKSLFKTNEQLHDFEMLVSQFVKDKDLDKALHAGAAIYKVKRKKITLDTKSIADVKEQHSGTVELLNEYLKDEYEDQDNKIRSQEINTEEITIEIRPKIETSHLSEYITGIDFTPVHLSTLELFVKSNFTVAHTDLETFAKSKGVFKNQLVESINDICYETLDDVLIEEDDDDYIINSSYYQRLLRQ